MKMTDIIVSAEISNGKLAADVDVDDVAADWTD